MRVVLAQVGRELETVGVTSQYFALLGQSIRGRDFTRDDNRSGAEPVAEPTTLCRSGRNEELAASAS